MNAAFTLKSPETGTHYRIAVETPDSVREPGPWPAVLFMDGDDQFQFAVSAYRAARGADEVRPLLLVGVGYGASYREPQNKRGRDYTPTKSDLEPDSGGADAFLVFLTQTLWPELTNRFAVADEGRGIAGHSLGSLVVLLALFQERPFFRHHLASAPSIWWDDRNILCHAQKLRARQEALPARLFLGVGENDSASMTGDLHMLEDQLEAQPFAQLDVFARRFPERDHFNVLPEAFRAGLVTLFGTS